MLIALMEGWGIAQFAIAAVVIIGVLAIAYVGVTKGMGIPIPDWAKQIFVIVLVIILVVVAIKIIMSL